MKSYRRFGSTLSTAIIYIALGALFCVFRQGVVSWGMLVFGALLIVKGVLDCVNTKSPIGTLAIVIGALLVILRFVLPNFIVQIFGICLAISGFTQLFNGSPKKLIPLINCVITLVAGILLVIFSGEALSTVFLISGIFLIIDGALVFLGKR